MSCGMSRPAAPWRRARRQRGPGVVPSGAAELPGPGKALPRTMDYF